MSEEPVKKAMDYAAVRDWPGYYRLMSGKPARETTVSALDRFDAGWSKGQRRPAAPVAVDLGCGEGRDAFELLRRGWRVIAIDSHEGAFEHLLARVAPEDRERLEVRAATFERAEWPRGVDLVNSSFSLPFCPPPAFPALWERIVASIRPGGRFAGQLFGDRDSWASLPDRSHQTEEEARRLLGAFEVEEFRVEEKDDKYSEGNPKHWHVFHIVARKR